MRMNNAPETKEQMLKRAIQFAVAFHDNDLDKSGILYLFHPFRVMDMARQLKLDIETQAIGVMHDLVEDTRCSLFYISLHFNKRIVDGIDALTRRNGPRAINGVDETYMEFVRRAASNPDARKIKPLDNSDNMRPERVVKPEGSDFSLPKRYHKSVNYLLDACTQAGEEEYVRKFKELVTWV